MRLRFRCPLKHIRNGKHKAEPPDPDLDLEVCSLSIPDKAGNETAKLKGYLNAQCFVSCKLAKGEMRFQQLLSCTASMFSVSLEH
jgi:hypothetical protein